MKKNMEEPKFAVSFVITAGRLGGLLAFLDNQAEELGVKLVKNIKAGGNLPRGAMKPLVVEILKKAGGKLAWPQFVAALKAQGVPDGSISSSVYSGRLKSVIIRKGGMVHLKKGVE